VEATLRGLLATWHPAVLATQRDGNPYGSLVTFWAIEAIRSGDRVNVDGYLGSVVVE
jgi:hypothetical protein